MFDREFTIRTIIELSTLYPQCRYQNPLATPKKRVMFTNTVDRYRQRKRVKSHIINL